MANEKLMKGDVVPFAKNMKRLVNQREFSDIKFIVGEGRRNIYAHRCILASRCEVFRAMFADQNNEKDIPFVMSETDPEVFVLLLEFIYTNCVTLHGKTAVDVLASAIEYGLDELRRLCIQYLVENLSMNTACEAIQAAVTYGQDDLKQKTLAFIEKHTKDVFKTRGFQELSEKSLCVVLQSNKLTLDELDVLAAVKDWAAVSSAVSGDPVQKVIRPVIRLVRLALLSPEELQQVEKDHEKQQLITMALISYAWKFHALHTSEKGNLLTTLRKGTKARNTHQGLTPWDKAS
ncbi:BTB/POZ domain-containing protein 19-like [Amphiura filiformis]|uniref:BTB/POZ domain-containing protein 19-like n=1 Tax=Amphiura filiformis TaxID=82378 RepID=UPI003B225BAC